MAVAPKKIYIIAGEASGDLHASNLMREVKREEENVDFRFWGGDNMQEVGGALVKHIRELAFMGFIEVVANLRTILGNIKFCKKDILAYKPDVLVLVDYPGFNLRIAEWAHEQGIKVVYYISPQIWAWKQSRVHKIKKVVDKMFVILPFEKDFYKKFDFEVEFVGHPLLDAIHNFEQKVVSRETFISENKLSDLPIIAVLPGSRKQEVSKKLPIMLKALESLTNYQIVIAGAPSLTSDFYEPMLNERCKIVYGQTYQLLSHSENAVVTSGTATLETALFEVPEVVCYKSSAISYSIAKKLIKIKYISLVNLIMDKPIVAELIQHECNPTRILEELKPLLVGGNRREQMLQDFKELKKNLGGGGASQKVAQSLLKTID
jgi:lipid-A-disaccharide synthase